MKARRYLFALVALPVLVAALGLGLSYSAAQDPESDAEVEDEVTEEEAELARDISLGVRDALVAMGSGG